MQAMSFVAFAWAVVLVFDQASCCDFQKYCANRCMMGRGGILCNCNANHFTGKRSGGQGHRDVRTRQGSAFDLLLDAHIAKLLSDYSDKHFTKQFPRRKSVWSGEDPMTSLQRISDNMGGGDDSSEFKKNERSKAGERQVGDKRTVAVENVAQGSSLNSLNQVLNARFPVVGNTGPSFLGGKNKFDRLQFNDDDNDDDNDHDADDENSDDVNSLDGLRSTDGGEYSTNVKENSNNEKATNGDFHSQYFTKLVRKAERSRGISDIVNKVISQLAVYEGKPMPLTGANIGALKRIIDNDAIRKLNTDGVEGSQHVAQFGGDSGIENGNLSGRYPSGPDMRPQSSGSEADISGGKMGVQSNQDSRQPMRGFLPMTSDNKRRHSPLMLGSL